MVFAQADDRFRITAIPPPVDRNDLRSPEMCNSLLSNLQRRPIAALCAGIVIVTLCGPIHAEEQPESAETVPPQVSESPDRGPAETTQAPVDPFIKLQGSVWRTKSGIVFLKTPIGLLTLTSKT